MTTKDLEMMAGSTWLMNIAIKREQTSSVFSNGTLTPTTTLVALDLSTATDIEFCVKKTRAQPAPKMLFKSLGSGLNKVDNGVNGVIQVHLDPIDTVKMTPGAYEYDLWIVLNNSRVPALRGKFTILGAVNTDV